MSQNLLSQGLERIDTNDLLSLEETSTNLEALIGISGVMNFPNHNMQMQPQHPQLHLHIPQQPQQFYAQSYGSTPDHMSATPSLDDLDTDFQFEVDVPMEEKEKKLWYYDARNKRLFVNGNQRLSAHITCKAGSTQLYLRLMPVYTSLADVHKPVNRCPNHKDQSRSEIREHIVHCHNEGAKYVGHESGESFGERLSVVIPLRKSFPPRGYPELIREEINFSFACLNSCSGISRRATALIFTLETECMQILGRKVMNFRACTSPKRDFDNDCKKRGLGGVDAAAGQPSAKRPMIVKNPDGSSQTLVKVESDQSSQEDSGPPPSPSRERVLTLTLPDNEACLRVLYQVQDFLSGEVTRGKAVNKEYFKQIGKQIKEVTSDMEKAKGS